VNPLAHGPGAYEVAGINSASHEFDKGIPARDPPRRLWRSALALLGGFVTVVALSLGTDLGLHAAGIFPPWGQAMEDKLFLLATAYRIAYGMAGSYVTAWLAPSRPMQHALVGGAIGLVLSALGAVATWNRGPAFGPHWYPLALIATAMPCAWVGGKLREHQGYGAGSEVFPHNNTQRHTT